MATSTDREPWREALRISLAHRAGSAPDTNAVAEATAATWSQVAAVLTPVIGTRGIDVIFRRSLYLTSKAFPWLAFGEEHGDSSVLLASLKARLAGKDTDEAREAGYALMVTFTELLTTLIGTSLTERMLSPVWASPEPSSARKMKP